MPKEVLEKLVWLFLLLPGFLCVAIVGIMVDLGELSEFQITFYSFILTLIIAVISLPVSSLICGRLSATRQASSSPRSENYIFFLTSVVVSSVLGIGLGLAAEQGRFFMVLRSLPITDVINKRSSSRPLVFLLSQNSAGRLKQDGDARPKQMKQTEAMIRVQMKEGHIYEGWPEFYELRQESTEVYLSPACRETPDGKGVEPIPGPGVIIKESEVRAVEFLDRSASPCWAYFEPLYK